MIKIAVCDDDELHLDHICRLAADAVCGKAAGISPFSSAAELLIKIEYEKYCPDIALLDIKMPEIDGIRLANEIHSLSPDCKIIFISSYIDYAPAVYDAEHIYFVLKSQLAQRLPLALEKAIQKLDVPENYIILKCSGTVTRLPAGKVLYLERELHKTKVITSDGTVATTQSPRELLSQCGCPELFIRSHQSYWVNSRHISSMDANDFILFDGTHIPISRSRRAEAKEAFFKILAEK